jgi:hypothetical protein
MKETLERIAVALERLGDQGDYMRTYYQRQEDYQQHARQTAKRAEKERMAQIKEEAKELARKVRARE